MPVKPAGKNQKFTPGNLTINKAKSCMELEDLILCVFYFDLTRL